MMRRFVSNIIRKYSTPTASKPPATTPTPVKKHFSQPAPKSEVELDESIPGFRTPGVIATDYELAVGVERYELLKNLRGEDPWEDLHPIEFTKLGTVKAPILVGGIDCERYIGCTGFPADSHPIVFLTVREHEEGHVDRCNICGNVFKYTVDQVDESH